MKYTGNDIRKKIHRTETTVRGEKLKKNASKIHFEKVETKTILLSSILNSNNFKNTFKKFIKFFSEIK